ncbi:unnamed protein product, partial [Durusdinium trenchii]
WSKCWEQLQSGKFSSAPAQTVTVTVQLRSADCLLTSWNSLPNLPALCPVTCLSYLGNMCCSCPPIFLVTPARVRRMRWHVRLTICL